MGLRETFGMSEAEFAKAMAMASGDPVPMDALPPPKPPTAQELRETKARADSLNAYASQYANLKVNPEIQKKLDDANRRLGITQTAQQSFKAALPVQVKPPMATKSKVLIGAAVIAAVGAGWFFLRRKK